LGGACLRASASRVVVALIAFAAAAVALAIAPPAQAQEAPQVLLFHDGSDPATDAGVDAIEGLAADNDFDVTVTSDAGDLNADNLDGYAALVFLGVEGEALGDAQVNAVRDYVRDGNGFLGIGTTATAMPGSNFFTNLIGARPDGDASGPEENVAVFGDRVHPSTAELPLELNVTDSFYTWEDRPTGDVHVVARWRAPGDPAGDGTDVAGTDHELSWCHDFQGGRSFYTALGQTAGVFDVAEVQDHLLGAIQWTAGLVRANCKATVAQYYEGERLVNGASGDLQHTGEAHGLTIAPNGWVIYIGRGDCRTNEARGQIAGLDGPTGRILDFANPNVGVGCGTVHIFDPEEYDGSVNSGVNLAGIIPVYGDRGGGDEINGKIEAGLLGITVAPDFETTGHVYVQYFPTFNPANPHLPGAQDGADRRRTKMHEARVSRFTIDLETKTLDLDSEVIIFQYESQIYSCCHRGGGMGFDSEGNLYITVGDSNSSQSTNGYSGNHPTFRCPQRNPRPGPGDPANTDDCGELNFSFRDARRTAGSTNDYNGKMLRFNPIEGIADGEQPEVGEGTTYTLPTADSPNGPNLFDGTEGGGELTRPEIYAMGLRNPSRLYVDPETDIPYTAWVGPDAGSPSVDQGPSTYESAAQIAQAGNYGWPYCMGNQQAYRDRVAPDGDLRTTNEPGFVDGGPAGDPIPGWYDCENIVNNSPNNTGLEVLPHETGTGMDAGTARPVNIWYSRGNPGGANGCPDFPRPNGAPDYSANPVELCPYATASGATIMNGPVYRYPDTADQSVAWPEYWDGRWFLFDWNNNSIKHGLLLDPETDQDGGQPIWADSLRGVINWGANYMDSKFAPDGSLYVQVYQGFFTTGNETGLYRFTYTGGPDTPGADPQWEATGNPREIQFDIGSSGGVSYEWDFDGDEEADSTEASPVHTFEEDGEHEVTLTVTYADGETDSKTITVNVVGDDTQPPTTTIQLNGADPVDTYDGPVEVTLTAEDEGAGVDVTQYRVDGGDITAYEEPFTVRGNGEHTVEYRSRDAAGNVEDWQSVTFTIDTQSGGGSCLPQTDEFEGDELDGKWDVLRPADGGPQVANGHVHIPLVPGDMIGGSADAGNVMLQDAPSGQWTATTRMNLADFDEPGKQGGLIVWQSESPNTFSKIVYLENNNGNRQFEHIVTQDGDVVSIDQSITVVEDDFPEEGHVFLRARYDGTQVVAEFSTDGESWTHIGNEDHGAPFEGEMRVGLTAFRNSSASATTVGFDWFRVREGSAPSTPIDCEGGGGDCSVESDPFEDVELDPKWEIINPSSGNQPTVGDGHLTLPVIQGDLYGDNGSAQVLAQGVPTDESWIATAKIRHENIDTNGEAAGLALINRFNPNHFMKTAIQYKSDTDPGQDGDQPGKWAERVLTADSQAVILPGEDVPWPNSGALDIQGEYVWARFVYDAGSQEVSTWTSIDGTTFVNFGANVPVDEYLSEPGGLRIGLFAKHDGSGDDEVQIDEFNLVHGSTDPQTPGDDCGGGGGGDNTPPTTTATTDPADPNGENGWFTTPVEVTLEATDNEGGSGVETTEYRVDGGEFQAYDGPFTVEGDGRHEVEYRSTDAEGNTEATKSLELPIDGTPPTTTANLDGNELTLEADDGDGSGVARTEFRIDGGEWQEYAQEEVILNSAADLERWEQAGPGGLEWVDEEGGFARTQGGLGMPWYPVREYGDFSLKLQWRDSSSEGNGNAGVFVRFPDPRIPLDERPESGPGDWDGEYCGRTGSAATQPAWVAIYCGHEIQINDHQGDVQKTGSIYNFAPVDEESANIQPKGTWVDYEIRVEGQQYTIIRNGEVINEFDNSVPKDSSRAGDPPTQARQFDSGYIGLQNHGNPDVIDYRNVRVQRLDDGVVQGPVEIPDGAGLVEFRSTDAAGNTEDVQELDLGGGGSANLRAQVKPRKAKAKPRKAVRFRVTVANRGDASAEDVRICAQTQRKKARIMGSKCREAPSIGAGNRVRAAFRVKVRPKAAGKRVRVKFVARTKSAKNAKTAAVIRVQKAKKKKRR
jgi:PKD repeat protein/glucose/arabinose dehydrogenase/type 1 glutamine amidotransferase